MRFAIVFVLLLAGAAGAASADELAAETPAAYQRCVEACGAHAQSAEAGNSGALACLAGCGSIVACADNPTSSTCTVHKVRKPTFSVSPCSIVGECVAPVQSVVNAADGN